MAACKLHVLGVAAKASLVLSSYPAAPRPLRPMRTQVRMAARELMLRLGGKGPDSHLIMPLGNDEDEDKPIKRRRRRGGKPVGKGEAS